MQTSPHNSKIFCARVSIIRETAHAFLQQAGFYSKSKRSLPIDSSSLALINQLCNWSFSPEPPVAKMATAAIFGSIIEPLCDDFSDHGVQTANLVLTRILQFIRATPEGAALNRLLNDFGFTDATSLLNRYQRLQQITPLTTERNSAVKKILILSRVTAGADIAITNIIIHRLRLHFANADLILIGPAHLPELFAFVKRCRHINFLYKNDGSLFDKMSSWPSLLNITKAEQEGFLPEEVLLFDPDTRLSQLGLLPLAPDDRTCYFPSRASQRGDKSTLNLSTITNLWLNQLLGETVVWQPNLIFERKGEAYHTFCQSLHQNGCQRVVVINFGVGNNPRKKVHGGFEEELIETLLANQKTIVILDTGRGQHKGQWMADHLARVRTLNFPVICLHDSEITKDPVSLEHGLIIFNGSLGSLGKMIDAADCFIGYDSCGQHLAAATSTPAIIIFAGAPSTRFIHRWSPDAIGNLTIPFNSSTATPQETNRLIVDITQAVTKIQPKA